MEAPESASHRSYFYVGGVYMNDEDYPGERVMQGQMYVEQLTPPGGSRHPFPLVFIHGGGQTASNWLNTPDGRKGWASYFLDHGYVVYLIDSPTRGRSAWQPSSNALVKVPVSFAEEKLGMCLEPVIPRSPDISKTMFEAGKVKADQILGTATAEYKLWPQAHLHTQWPGTGHPGDPIFDAYFASTVQFLGNLGIEQGGLKAAGSALLDRIGSAILITHSQGAPSGWLIADARPKLVKAIIAVEPNGPPFAGTGLKGPTRKPYGITDIPITYDPPPEAGDGAPLREHRIAASPPTSDEAEAEPWILQQEPARRLVNLLDTIVIVVTAEASYHAAYDGCTVKFLRQAGLKEVEWLRLAEHGIRGNGHMMFMELNNMEIAELLERRIARVR